MAHFPQLPAHPLFGLTSLFGSMLSLRVLTNGVLTIGILSLGMMSHAQAAQSSLKAKAKTADTFLECSQVADNAARLACFDKVSDTNHATVVGTKQPLDLAKTVAVSVEAGKAQPVLADGSTPDLPPLSPRIAKITHATKSFIFRKPKAEENSDTVATPDQLSTTNAQALAESDTLAKPIANNEDKILQKVGVAKSDLQRYTPLSVLYDLDKNDPKGTLTLRPHQPMYVMPLWYSATPNYHVQSPTHEVVDYTHDQLNNFDSKMQISLKTKLVQDVFNTNADVWVGYTQQAYWQVYNAAQSRPFRNMDYQPEVFITQPVKANLPWGGDLRVLGAGLVHQSNGQSDPLSRSWNRGYIMGGAEWGKLTVIPRLWFIFPENNKTSDNPDIGDYMGYGDVRVLYNLGEKNTLGGVVRYNPVKSKGAIQIDYARPIWGGMKGYVQLFHGYGENIQDYNHLSTSIGLGLMFNDFLGL